MTKLQLLKADIKAASETLKSLRVQYKAAAQDEKEFRAIVKVTKATQKALKVQDREAKKALRIEKLKAKLEALQSPPVGIKAKKAARKPSKVVTITA